MNELMEKIQDLKTEFNKETEISKRTQTEMKMQLKNSVTKMGDVEPESAISCN